MVRVNIKQMVAWAVALAVLVLFLLAMGPLGNFAAFGASGIASIITGVCLFLVGGVAAVVAMYWGRK